VAGATTSPADAPDGGKIMRLDGSFGRIFIACALALAAVRAEAATRYVNAASASPNEDGSQANPYLTIQPAIEAATAGDEVRVAPGVYYGSVELKGSVLLVSEKGPDQTIIDGLGAPNDVLIRPPELGATALVDGFTLRNGVNAMFVVGRPDAWAYNQTYVKNCVVRDVVAGFTVTPMAFLSLEHTAISNVLTGVGKYWGVGAKLTNVTIDRADAAVRLHETGLDMSNTTITSSNAGISGGGYYSSIVSGANNNFWNNGVDVQTTWADLPTMNVTGSMAVDPAFVDRALGDYHLSPGSPLIDAGAPIGLPFVGAAPDVGAFEYGVAGPTDHAATLAESFARVPVSAYRNAAEQRSQALQKKLFALVDLLDRAKELPPADALALCQEALDKLEHDVWAKADGFFGGNPANDWIRTQSEQAGLHENYVALRDAILAEIARLGSTP